MKQLAFKEWKRGKKQLPIVVTGQDHPTGGSPPEYLDGFFADSFSVPIHQSACLVKS